MPLALSLIAIQLNYCHFTIYYMLSMPYLHVVMPSEHTLFRNGSFPACDRELAGGRAAGSVF